MVFDQALDSAQFSRLLDSASDQQLWVAATIASWWPDTAEMAIRLTRTWQQRQADRGTVR